MIQFSRPNRRIHSAADNLWQQRITLALTTVRAFLRSLVSSFVIFNAGVSVDWLKFRPEKDRSFRRLKATPQQCRVKYGTSARSRGCLRSCCTQNEISYKLARRFVPVLNDVSYASEMLMFVLQSVSVHIMFDTPQIKENGRIFQSLVRIPLKPMSTFHCKCGGKEHNLSRHPVFRVWKFIYCQLNRTWN